MNGSQAVTDPPSQVPPGWDKWYSLLGHTKHYDYDLYIKRHRDPPRRVRRGQRDQGRRPARPCSLSRPTRRPRLSNPQLDEPAPHIGAQQDPYGDCAHAPIPERRDEHAFDQLALPRPPSALNEDDMSDKPPFLRGAPKLGPAEVNQVRRRRRCALASSGGGDRAVALRSITR